jgi:hypothetical protein
MAKKRLSMAELQMEEAELSNAENLKIEKLAEIHLGVAEKKEVRILKNDDFLKNREFGKLKDAESLSDYTKMSVTVAVDVFEKLQDISRQRRRSKQPFKLTELVREALSDWLPKQS